MIYILHHNRYWTEYVDFLLSDPENFSLVASPKAVEGYQNFNLETMEKYHPAKHTPLLCCGRLQELTNQSKIMMRFSHSPGFFVYPMIRTYADLLLKHKDSDYRFLILEEYYRAAIKAHIPDDTLDQFRFLLMDDPKVIRLKTDPNLFLFKDAKKCVAREPGTALISFSSRLIDYDLTSFVSLCKHLKKKLNLTLLLHPLMRLDQKKLHQITALQDQFFDKIFYNLNKTELIDLYDLHEYIITDGSGSCYEALIRGCKPLVARDLTFIPSEASFNEVLNEEYLPFPSYQELHQNYDSDDFLHHYFGYLYQHSAEESKVIAKNEILNLS